MQKNKNYWGPILRPVQIGAIAILTVISLLIANWLYRDTREKSYIELEHTLSVLTQYYRQSFYHRELNLTSVGYRLVEITGPKQDSLRLSLARRYLEYNSELMAYGLANKEGKLTTFTGQVEGVENPNLMNSEDSRRSFIQAKKAKGLVLGEVYYFDAVKDWVLPIRVPLRNREDSLLAINTSAISYKTLIKTIEGFDFNPNFRIHFINGEHNSTQIYFPLDSLHYQKWLGDKANIYVDTSFTKRNKELVRFKAINLIEDSKVIGVKADADVFQHYFVVSVDDQVITYLFVDRVRFLLIVYFFLVLLVFLGINYLMKNDNRHSKELDQERKYSDDIIHGSPALIVGISNNGICSFANPATLAAIFYEEQEIVGHHWWKKLYPNDYYKQVTKLFEDVNKGNVVDYEMTLIRKDGVERIVSWNSLSFFDENGEPTEIVGFGHDVTELKQAQLELKKYTQDLEEIVKERTGELTGSNKALIASNYQLKEQHQVLKDTLENLENTQKQLFQADKMASLGVLLAGVGHEINNPLNFISGGVQGLKNLVDDESARPFYAIIEEGVKRAANIVKSLSHFSRKNDQMNEECNTHLIIENCLTILQNRLKHRVEIEKNFTANSPIVIGSEGKLHQAILNVLSNAEQAIEGTGKIIISTSIDKKQLLISIKDTGKGIAEEDLSRVGDPFFTTKEVGKGTGLGLSITYSIIEEHKGSVVLFSEISKGSEFIIKLPV